MPTTSDIQFIAEMLRRARSGDQITAQETHRLDEIADYGYTRGTPIPENTPQIVNPATAGRQT